MCVPTFNNLANSIGYLHSHSQRAINFVRFYGKSVEQFWSLRGAVLPKRSWYSAELTKAQTILRCESPAKLPRTPSQKIVTGLVVIALQIAPILCGDKASIVFAG